MTCCTLCLTEDGPNGRISDQESHHQRRRGSQSASEAHSGPYRTTQEEVHRQIVDIHTLNGYREVCLVLECEESHPRSSATGPST